MQEVMSKTEWLKALMEGKRGKSNFTATPVIYCMGYFRYEDTRVVTDPNHHTHLFSIVEGEDGKE